MSKLRQSARGEQCTLMIPLVCNFNSETVVLAHAPSPDKGMGIKSSDWWGCYCCSSCHDVFDKRTKYDQPELIPKYLLTAIYRTQKRMIENGLITIGDK